MRPSLLLIGLASTVTPSVVLGQVALSACPAEQVVGDLGIDGLECQGCEIRGRPRREASWIRFSGEPRIHSVRAAGPAAGRLEPGDVIATIDSLPITSRAGSDRYARLEPNQVVHLEVRRSGRLLDVPMVAQPICGAPPSRAVVRRFVRLEEKT